MTTTKKSVPAPIIASVVSNTKTFKTNITSINTSGATLRQTVQNAAIQAIEFFVESTNKKGDKDHGDTGYLTKLMTAVCLTNCLSHTKLKAFIEHHTNVKWTKITTKDGQVKHVFKKVGKEIEVKAIDGMWYNYNTPKKDPTKAVEKDYFKSMTTLHSAWVKGEVIPKKGTEEVTAKMFMVFEELLATLTAA